MNSTSCQRCGSRLVDHQLSLEEHALHGDVLFCRSCQLFYFKRGMNYILPDGSIQEPGGERDPFQRLYQALKTPGAKVVHADETGLIVVQPSRDEATNTETIAFMVGASRLDEAGSSIFWDIRMFVLLALVQRTRQLIDISFLGLRQDPRPVWQIPEVVAWCHSTWAKMQYITCFLTAKSLVGYALAVCCGLPQPHIDMVLADRPDLRGMNPSVPAEWANERITRIFGSQSMGAFETLLQDDFRFAREEIPAWTSEAVTRFTSVYDEMMPRLIGEWSRLHKTDRTEQQKETGAGNEDTAPKRVWRNGSLWPS